MRFPPQSSQGGPLQASAGNAQSSLPAIAPKPWYPTDGHAGYQHAAAEQGYGVPHYPVNSDISQEQPFHGVDELSDPMNTSQEPQRRPQSNFNHTHDFLLSGAASSNDGTKQNVQIFQRQDVDINAGRRPNYASDISFSQSAVHNRFAEPMPGNTLPRHTSQENEYGPSSNGRHDENIQATPFEVDYQPNRQPTRQSIVEDDWNNEVNGEPKLVDQWHQEPALHGKLFLDNHPTRSPFLLGDEADAFALKRVLHPQSTPAKGSPFKPSMTGTILRCILNLFRLLNWITNRRMTIMMLILMRKWQRPVSKSSLVTNLV